MVKKIIKQNKENILNYVFQFGGILINIFFIKILINSLDKERFGIWQTMLTFVSYVALVNFGVGNGLRNYITKLTANNQTEVIGLALGKTVLKLIPIIATSLVVMPVIIYNLNFDFFFKDIKLDQNEIKYSLIIYSFFFIINIILSLVNSLSYGLQKSYLSTGSNFFNLATCFTIVLILNNIFQLNLIHIALIFGLSQSIVYIIYYFYLSRKFNIDIRFKGDLDLTEINKLSINFFVIELLYIVFSSLDNILISKFLGAQETADYSVVSKIFFVIIALFTTLLIKFWNNVTYAFEIKNHSWIHKELKKLVLISFGVFLFCLVITLFRDVILNLWIGKDIIKTSAVTFLLFSVFTFLTCINSILMFLHNGLGRFKYQLISYSIMILIYLGYFFCFKIDSYEDLVLLKVILLFIGIFVNSLIFKDVSFRFAKR